MHRRTLVGTAVTLPGLVAARHAVAQSDAWPDRTVLMIVPYAPGGSNDVVARLLTPGLQSVFGRSFVVENRAGGGGSVGMG